MEKELYVIYQIVLGVPIGLAGLIGSIVWYRSIGSDGEETISSVIYIGPLILGTLSAIILIWSILAIIAMIRARDEPDEDFR